MKAEARILVTECSEKLCASAILRGEGFDTIIIAGDCRELCSRLEGEGYIYELRYYHGACDCNLPQPPRSPGSLDVIVVFLRRLLEELHKL
ncbi:MAG: hypothetical protein P3X22_006580 [Thermoprotei archaeon]|nr:hypothetical protein [Thermoprotei archaeon]